MIYINAQWLLILQFYYLLYEPKRTTAKRILEGVDEVSIYSLSSHSNSINQTQSRVSIFSTVSRTDQSSVAQANLYPNAELDSSSAFLSNRHDTNDNAMDLRHQSLQNDNHLIAHNSLQLSNHFSLKDRKVNLPGSLESKLDKF